MKKLVLVAAFAIVGTVAFAQKPTSGNITTEIGLSSILGTPVNPGNSSGVAQAMLRGRYFMSESMAVRGSIGLGSGSTTTTLANTEETVSKTNGFGLAVGIEKHMAGTDKLSPYLGAELGIGSGGGSTEISNLGGTAGNTSKTTGGSATTIGLSALLGADYYITEKVYVGAELGVMLFKSTSVGDAENVTTIAGTSVTTKTLGSKGSNLGIAPSTLGLVRLGIVLF